MTFISAFILGLLASAHCSAMCGGLQVALQTQHATVIRSKRDTLLHLFALNVGRLTTYVLAGVILGFINLKVIQTINISYFAQIARIMAAIVLLLIGLQLIFSNIRPFVWLERYGAVIWSGVSRFLPKKNATQDYSKKRISYYRGLIWGCLPCGLIYSVLLVTILTNNPLQGGLTLLGFGIGTLPAMLLTGSLYQQFRQIIWSRAMQSLGGGVFIVGGGLMLLAPLIISKDFMHAYPILLNTVFCVT